MASMRTTAAPAKDETCGGKAWVSTSLPVPQVRQGVKRGRCPYRREGSREGKSANRRVVARPLQQEVKPVKLCLQELPAIVVNLDRRPDRMEGLSARMAAHCPWLRYSRFDASDGRRDQIEETDVVYSWHTGRNVHYQKLRSIRKGWDDLDSYQPRSLTLSPGERGCAMSHVRAWRHCIELAGDSEKPLLVLEDDAAPTPDFTPLLMRAAQSLPEDAHVLYLGYSQAAEWRREVSAELVESEYVWTTVGYIVWPAGARLMLSKLPIDQPVDNWMANLNATGELKSYCVKPKIIRQAEAWNVNSDVGHSDECYWGPDSDIRHSDDLYWGSDISLHSAAAPSGRKSIFFSDENSDSDFSDLDFL